MKQVFQLNEIKQELEKVEIFLNNYINFSHPSIKESSRHILQAGGKRIRPAFVLLSGSFFKDTPKDKLISLAAAVELIHMSSLVHDDVIDEADFRRGKPTIRVLRGNKFSLHVGDYLLGQALKLVDPKNNKEIANILSKVSVEMCQGEIQQLVSAYDPKQSVKSYLYRIKRKTALLIAASCQIGAIAANATPKQVYAFYKYGYYLGMAFQIKDDVLDFEANSKTLGKPAGSDLVQGILTLPAILTLKKEDSDSKRLAELIVSKFAQGEKDLEEALKIIKTGDAIENSLNYLSKYVDLAKKQVDYLPKCSFQKSLFKIADYIKEREY